MNPAPVHPLTLISKSHAEKSWECQRSEYWAYLWGLTGLRTASPQFDLEFGRIIHEAARHVATPGNLVMDGRQALDAIGPSLQLTESVTKQWGSIAAGLILAYRTRVFPAILHEYDVVDVEVPLVLPIDRAKGIWFVCKPDLILRHRITKRLWYWEHKTTGTIDAKWINAWTMAVQVHSGILAAERRYGEEFDGCIVLGWYKGRKDYYNEGMQSSPFAWGWRRDGAPGIVADAYAYTKPQKWKGWERFPTHELLDFDGWVQRMPDDVLLGQFARTPPIGVRRDLVADFFEQSRVNAEKIMRFRAHVRAVTSAHEAHALLNEYWPQNFNQCDPPYGNRRCWAKDLCWQGWVQADPVGSGLYVRHTGEHSQEFEALIRAEETRSTQ